MLGSGTTNGPDTLANRDLSVEPLKFPELPKYVVLAIFPIAIDPKPSLAMPSPPGPGWAPKRKPAKTPEENLPVNGSWFPEQTKVQGLVSVLS